MPGDGDMGTWGCGARLGRASLGFKGASGGGWEGGTLPQKAVTAVPTEGGPQWAAVADSPTWPWAGTLPPPCGDRRAPHAQCHPGPLLLPAQLSADPPGWWPGWAPWPP